MIPTYQGQTRQYGYGLGSMFKKAVKTVMPLIQPLVKSGLHTLKQQGVTQGKAAVRDYLSGTPIKKIVKNRGVSVLKNVGQSLLKAVTAKPIKPKRKRKLGHSSHRRPAVKKARPIDIFD